MQHTVAAIRAGRPRTRFTAPQTRHLEPRLGLRRASTLPVTDRQRATRAVRPLHAVREAARGLTAVTPPLEGTFRVRRVGEVSWSSATQTRRRPTSLRSAAPWRA